MSTLLTTIQSIAVKAVQSTNPVVFTYGTVTAINPLRIRIDESTVELTGDSLILTANVVEKTMTIKKHTHGMDEQLIDIASASTAAGGGAVTFMPGTNAGSGITLKHKHTNEDTIIEATVTEHGETLDSVLMPESGPTERVVTINRALKKGDKVVMLRVCSGQEYIILSRVFEEESNGN